MTEDERIEEIAWKAYCEAPTCRDMGRSKVAAAARAAIAAYLAAGEVAAEPYCWAVPTHAGGTWLITKGELDDTKAQGLDVIPLYAHPAPSEVAELRELRLELIAAHGENETRAPSEAARISATRERCEKQGHQCTDYYHGPGTPIIRECRWCGATSTVGADHFFGPFRYPDAEGDGS